MRKNISSLLQAVTANALAYYICKGLDALFSLLVE